MFNSEDIIKRHICDQLTNSNVEGFFVGFDYDTENSLIKSYRWEPLVDIIFDALCDFAFGLHEGSHTKPQEIKRKLREAAKSLYKIKAFKDVAELYRLGNESRLDELKIDDKYLNRGEFGELILHLILRDNFNTIPLISKIWFKDSYGHTVHGFDCIHVEPQSKSLWLGESKLYSDPKQGVRALLKDLDNHFNRDFLNDEFSLITKRLHDIHHIEHIDTVDRDYWVKQLSSGKSLKDKINFIKIPLFCTYSSDLFTKFDDENNPVFLKEYIDSLVLLKQYFDENYNHPFKKVLNIVLILFPVPSKIELVKKLHNKLNLLQQI